MDGMGSTGSVTGSEQDALVQRFERQRPRLVEVAYRLLGSHAEAEDAVQETWIRLGRVDSDQLTNLDGWLTTVVSRVALNMLRSRRTRREQPLLEQGTDPDAQDRSDRPGREDTPALTTDAEQGDPEHAAVLADSVGVAMMVVLDALSPTERIAFVLHDMFGVSFDEIGRITDRTSAAARQLASRARRRVRGAAPPNDTDLARRRRVVDAFLAAARGGDFETLLSLLAPDATLRSDEMAVRAGAMARLDGAHALAENFEGQAYAARPVLVDGVPGAIWAPGGRPRMVVLLTFDGDRISDMEVVGDPDRIAAMSLGIVREGA